MNRKTMIVAAIASAFAFPLAANAGSTDKQKQATNANDGGAAAMFKSMDKNADGFISKEEAVGSPHQADFASLDKNNDGRLSREEHANAKEHVAARASADTGGIATNDVSAKPVIK